MSRRNPELVTRLTRHLAVLGVVLALVPLLLSLGAIFDEDLLSRGKMIPFVAFFLSQVILLVSWAIRLRWASADPLLPDSIRSGVILSLILYSGATLVTPIEPIETFFFAFSPLTQLICMLLAIGISKAAQHHETAKGMWITMGITVLLFFGIFCGYWWTEF